MLDTYTCIIIFQVTICIATDLGIILLNKAFASGCRRYDVDIIMTLTAYTLILIPDGLELSEGNVLSITFKCSLNANVLISSIVFTQ